LLKNGISNFLFRLTKPIFSNRVGKPQLAGRRKKKLLKGA